MSDDALTLTITQGGQAALAAAQLATGAAGLLTIARLGLTDAVFVAAPTLDRLPGEFRRLDTLSGALTDDHTVHMVLRDDEGVTYGARGFGVYLADGTLFAVYGQPDRLFEKSVQVSLNVGLDIAFPVAGIDHITFGDSNWLNPLATRATPGVVKLLDAAGAVAGLAGVPDGPAMRQIVVDINGEIAGEAANRQQQDEAYAANAQQQLAGEAANLRDEMAGQRVAIEAEIAARVPRGTIVLFYGAGAPAGWAICDGQDAALPDGSARITTPDLRGRVAVGVSPDHVLGAAFGASTRQVTTDTDPTGVELHYATYGSYAGGGTQGGVAAGNNGAGPSLADPGHAHGVTVDVTQPSLALLYIIRL